MDKRQFHMLLNDLKDTNPNSIQIIESIQNNFDESFESITDSEKKALKQFPLQFIKRIPLENHEWTTQLHIWAENSAVDVLCVDPMLLSHKNSCGDSVLMCLVNAALGAYTEVIDYDLIKRILDTDMAFEYTESLKDGKDTIIKANALEVEDLNGQTPLAFLIDYAYADGSYKGQEPDPILQEILQKFADSFDYEESDDLDDLNLDDSIALVTADSDDTDMQDEIDFDD